MAEKFEIRQHRHKVATARRRYDLAQQSADELQNRLRTAEEAAVQAESQLIRLTRE